MGSYATKSFAGRSVHQRSIAQRISSGSVLQGLRDVPRNGEKSEKLLPRLE